MKQTLLIYTGKVDRDVHGPWSDCSPGLYIGNEMVETIFSQFRGKTIKITIEETDEANDWGN